MSTMSVVPRHLLPRGPVITRLMGLMLLVLWPVEMVKLLFHPPWLSVIAAYVFALYLLLAFAVTGWGNRLLGLALVLGIGWLAVMDGAWTELLTALEVSLVFAAFLPAVYFLRSVLYGDDRVLSYCSQVMTAAESERPAWMLIGSHVLGAALSVGALAIMSQVLEADADAETRRAMVLATVSGIALSLLWSPVFVAMAVTSEFVTDVPLWQSVLLGMGMASLGLLMALLLLRVPQKRRTVVRAVAALRPIIPLVAAAAASVILVHSITSLSTLESAALTLPPLALLLLRLQPPARRDEAVAATRRGLDGLGVEIAIVSLAFVLGAVMRASPSVHLLVEGLLGPELPPVLQIVLVVGGMIVAAALAIHPIVTGSILLALFAATDSGLADLILVGAVLLGWACGALVSVAGLLLIVASNILRISRQEMILGRNTVLVLLLAATGTLFLAALNAAFTT